MVREICDILLESDEIYTGLLTDKHRLLCITILNIKCITTNQVMKNKDTADNREALLPFDVWITSRENLGRGFL